MNIKALLSVGALAATGVLVFGKNKVGEYQNVLENLQFEVDQLKNISLKNGVNFIIDLKVINPTNTPINIPGKQLVIKTIHFYAKNGNRLGIAQPNISDINLPANGSRLIINIPVQLSISQIGENFSEVLAMASNPENLILGVDVEAFGKEFTLNP